MKVLSIAEAGAGLPRWLELALAGEEIQIRQADSFGELCPAVSSRPASASSSLAPREAQRQLQQNSRLSPADAAGYLREVVEERLAGEDRHRA